eukprot:CAMPEP_0182866352 /NCGR_PEP_ID=MMETSP0034_2-20130328/8161_1 /TAXON_ID=156128 /ORGANISM="Nephroselmis pyriformis, Strain CCMP717" /LENGTH=278 /DNA_ID=CAMNT_0024998679 /DNA_START=51 /DNA_END=883 /DNA_ORIENTATION=-
MLGLPRFNSWAAPEGGEKGEAGPSSRRERPLSGRDSRARKQQRGTRDAESMGFVQPPRSAWGMDAPDAKTANTAKGIMIKVVAPARRSLDSLKRRSSDVGVPPSEGPVGRWADLAFQVPAAEARRVGGGYVYGSDGEGGWFPHARAAFEGGLDPATSTRKLPTTDSLDSRPTAPTARAALSELGGAEETPFSPRTPTRRGGVRPTALAAAEEEFSRRMEEERAKREAEARRHQAEAAAGKRLAAERRMLQAYESEVVSRRREAAAARGPDDGAAAAAA